MNKQIEIQGLETYWVCPVEGCEEHLESFATVCSKHDKKTWEKAYAERWQIHRQVYFYCGVKIGEEAYRNMLPDARAKRPGLWEALFCQHCRHQLDEATGDCVNRHLAKQASCSARWVPTKGWTLNDNRVDGTRFVRDNSNWQARLKHMTTTVER